MNTRYFKSVLFAAALCCSTAFVACEAEDVMVGKMPDNGYESIYENSVQVSDAASGKQSKIVELWSAEATADLKVSLTKSASETQHLTAVVDAAYVAAYNQKNGTSYELYPAGLVAFADNGAVSVAAGAKEATVTMTVTASDELDPAKDYMVPVAVTGEGVESYDKASHCVYIISDMRSLPTCDKGEGAVKGYLFFEVNDVNPLNALSFELANGKLLWDVVVLFAANINYDTENQRAYINCNPNVQYLLDNNETYLQPLRRRGIKVLLGLLGNHDIAGLAQLSEIGAKDFAAEVAYYCEAYNLDGVNYDDEYSQSPDLTNPYFVRLSTDAAARLCYETKLAMPDKLVTVFDWGYMYGTETVDGVDADEWIDVVVANYGTRAYPVGNMGYEKCSGCSIEFNLGSGHNLNANTANTIQSGGYGWVMGFAPSPAKYSSQFSRLVGGPEVLWGAGIKQPTVFYKKNDPTPYVWPDDL